MVAAESGGGGDREIGVAVADGRVVVTKNVVLEVWVSMSGGNRTRTRLIQCLRYAVENLWQPRWR